MRTSSRAALALATGLVTATGVCLVASPAAQARPAPATSAHHISVTIPGTGISLTAEMTETDAVTSTSAGDDQGDEVTIAADDTVQFGDGAEPVDTGDNNNQATQDQAGDQGTQHQQGSDNTGTQDQQGDDQGSTDDQGTDDQGTDDQGTDDQQGDDQGTQDQQDGGQGPGDQGSGDQQGDSGGDAGSGDQTGGSSDG